jgi:hypothetical protein
MNKVFLIATALGVLAVIYLSIADNSEQKLSATDVASSGTINRPVITSDENKSNTANLAAQKQKMEERYQTVSDNEQVTSLEQRIGELNQLYPYREFSSDEVLDLLAQSNAWESSSEVPESLPITDEQRNDGRAFIELNPERFQVLLPGDTIEMPLEKLGMRLEIKIDSREALPDGGFTLHGHVLGSDELMRATITQGPGLSLAGIDTPQGHVVMQANDTHGWVATSETLFKQDQHKTDVLLPTDE